MKNRQALFMLLLIAILVFSSLAFGTSRTAIAKNASVPDSDKLATVPEELLKPVQPKNEVRIIVELDKAPAIESATKKGILYNELPNATKDNLEAAVANSQKTVKAAVTKAAPSIQYEQSFTTVFNGFSAVVPAGAVEKIAGQKGVKAVYEATEYQRPEPKPEMKYSKELVQAQRVWNDYGFKGEGMVVGVIDTGIDPTHKDMRLTDNATGEITKAEVEALRADGSLQGGQFFSAKVPFGYNYVDANNEIRDIRPNASMHGMHVAGTVGANGNEATGGIQGVAPETQLLALKVFGNDATYESTYGDIYIKAMDDAIKLGADVINMSLGATAGFVDSTDPEQQAVERATNNGILVSISAGNSNLFGSGHFNPLAANPDYGLSGSPSVSADSFGVASFENSRITAKSFAYRIGTGEAARGIYFLGNNVDPTKLPQDAYPVMNAGLGAPADFAGKDFKGKVALVARGTIPFTEKGLNAQKAGAAAVIIYNNTTGTVSMQSDPAITIPYMSTLQSVGLAMKAGLDAGQPVTVTFDGQYFDVPSETAGKMSDFTSWGPTPNLDFKPEITAPGGNIFSTLNNNEYGLMSGTSMAAPHVSGGAALLFERLKDLNLSGRDRVDYAKNLMMNTANPVEFAKGQFVSPRRQGAGLMQLHDALATRVMVTDKITGQGKVALKEIEGDRFTMTLTADNLSDQPAEFKVAVNVQVDAVTTTNGKVVTAPNNIGSVNITKDTVITAPASITVPAGGSADIPVTVDLIDAAGPLKSNFPNGFFVDGFVTLTDDGEEVTGNTELVVPYFGFNGSWDDAPIFDRFAWDPNTFYGFTLLADPAGNILNGNSHSTGYQPERFAFSPNGDGVQDAVIPVFSLLRNAKALEVNILSAAGEKLRTIRTDQELAKNFSATAPNMPYVLNPLYAWDGNILGKRAADGPYRIQLRAIIDYEGAEWQTTDFPIIVDTVKPAAKATFNAETKTIQVASFTDNLAADRWEVFLNGTELTENTTTPANESLAPSTTSYTVTPALKATDKLSAVFYDVAGNKTEVALAVAATPAPVADETEPAIFIDTPAVLSIHKTKTVEVTGRVEDASKVASLTINGQAPREFNGSVFKHTVTLEDGSRYITVKAVDAAGNDLEIRRQIFVDTVGPTIELIDVPTSIPAGTDEAEITFRVKDNFDQIRVYLIDSEIYYHPISRNDMVAFDETITETIKVPNNGANNFMLVAEDLAGHRTPINFKITKQAP
ncbi:S8 family serine peptidase [Planococcus liqunii]|uniref:S8 family serine peptidase n=1 Tax=Planococcus liqunii TaxID=3058394 RepID=UPI00260B8FF6|nr:S8 family serine peptidase [Planococcus sp. N056]WKA50239.1 S8 family serine peptidase [Planococcus sp. N056]